MQVHLPWAAPHDLSGACAVRVRVAGPSGASAFSPDAAALGPWLGSPRLGHAVLPEPAGAASPSLLLLNVRVRVPSSLQQSKVLCGCL